MPPTQRFADSFHFAECPRWHDDALWLSDMDGRTVYRLDGDGRRQAVHAFADDRPGGLGWLPDGRLLVVGMDKRCVYRIEDGNAVVHADLAPFASWGCNDMIVTDDGIAFVSQIGFDLYKKTTPIMTTALLRVDPDGTASVAADELLVPNGVALTADGTTMVVAETWAERLTRFRVASDGSLSHRETMAQLTPAAGVKHARPDGLCLDAEDAAWVADVNAHRVVRVDRDGRLTDEITVDGLPLAAVLGGPDRRTLYICVAQQIGTLDISPDPLSRIESVAVEVPGAGRP
jgi:sugar lactone lactonase YvrE